MPPDDHERERLLAKILREHAELVTKGRTLDETLGHLALGACLLGGVPTDRGLIRVIDPDTLFRLQEARSDGAWLRPFLLGRGARRGMPVRASAAMQSNRPTKIQKDADAGC